MARIKVLFDEQIFLLQRDGGISRYFVELIKQFREHPELEIDPVVSIRSSLNRYALEELCGPEDSVTEISSKLRAVFELSRSVFTPTENLPQVDVIHQTFYLPGFMRRYPELPKVVTVFDMIPESIRGVLQVWNPHFSKRSYIMAAAGVASISNTTARAMRQNYNRFDLAVSTTHLGVSEIFRPGIPRLHGMPNQYLLFVGARKGYKNWKLAVRSLAQISKTHPNLRLILVGGGKILASERYLTIRLGVQNKVGVVSVSDRDLSSIYSNASALVYPSNFEGFGLPLLEAMASGVPIVASDIMINREVCGPAAFYFHKDDVNSLTYALSKALIKNQEVADLLLAGLERAKTFTWYKCAEATAQIYRRAASKRRV